MRVFLLNFQTFAPVETSHRGRVYFEGWNATSATLTVCLLFHSFMENGRSELPGGLTPHRFKANLHSQLAVEERIL